MKLKNAVLLVVSGALAVLLSGCGAKDCPSDLHEQLEKAMKEGEAGSKGKSPEEKKKMCFEKIAQFKKHDGCKLAEKDKDGNVINWPKDDKGNKYTNFPFKKVEDQCNAI